MSQIFFKILTVSISMTPIIFLITILNPLFNRNYKTNWKYWMWLAISLRLILPFSLSGESLFNIKFPIEEQQLQQLVYDDANALHNISVKNNTINSVGAQSFNINFIEIIAICYFSVVFIYLSFKIINYLILRKNIRKWCSEPTGDIAKIASHIGMINGIKFNRFKLQVCKVISSPMVIGIFKPMLLIPNEEYEYIKLKMIFSHEIVHIKRHDTAYKLLLMIVCAIHWFNPVVHIMCKIANNDLELSCDTKALKDADLEEKKIYSLMIIDIASQNFSRKLPVLVSSFGSSKESLEARIKNICSTSSKKEGNIILVLVIIMALMFGTAFRVGKPEVVHKELNQFGQLENNKIKNNEAQDSTNEVESVVEKIDEEEPIDSDKRINIELNQNQEKEQDNEINNSDSQLPSEVQDAPSQQVEIIDDINESSEESAEIVIIDLNQLNDDDLEKSEEVE